MNIEDIIKGKGKTLFTVKKTTSAFDAATILDRERVGVLMVIDDKDNVAGILSERDILYKCYKTDIPLKERKVEDLMTKAEDIIVGRSDDTPRALMNIMVTKGIRHIPIMEGDAIKGIVSIEDLLKFIVDKSEIESRKLREYIENPFGVHIYNND